jgi:hypothetical protein
MLLPDIGEPMRRVTDPGRWQEVLQLWGQMQRASTTQIDQLLAAGCLDRRLDVLAAQIDPLLDDPTVLNEVPEREIATLRGLAPQLKALGAKLACAEVPAALVHGDLHGGNIAAPQGVPMIFDWSDGCIAHPFIDLLQLNIAWALPDGDDGWARLRDDYLLQWIDYAPLHRLRQIADLAEPLAALHHAVSYQHILRGIEPAARGDHAGVVAYWLGEVVKGMSRVAA